MNHDELNISGAVKCKNVIAFSFFSFIVFVCFISLISFERMKEKWREYNLKSRKTKAEMPIKIYQHDICRCFDPAYDADVVVFFDDVALVASLLFGVFICLFCCCCCCCCFCWIVVVCRGRNMNAVAAWCGVELSCISKEVRANRRKSCRRFGEEALFVVVILS